MNSFEDGALVLPIPHQNVFRKNFELLKVKFQKYASSSIDYSLINELAPFFNEFMIQNLFSIGKKDKEPELFLLRKNTINTFLFKLAKYEIQTKISHHLFGSNDWKTFGETIGLSSNAAAQISELLFQNNFKNYKWSSEEDLLLKHIIIELNPDQNEKNKWNMISNAFNLQSNEVQFRKPSQCKERWENILRRKFKKGEWSQNEDLQILRFVLNNGTKWAKLSRMMEDRTEHCVKNRFFGLLGKYCLIPIKTIKKEVNYLDSNFILEAIKYYQKLYEKNDEKNESSEFKWDSFFKQFEDILLDE